jgi:hypothetical protein
LRLTLCVRLYDLGFQNKNQVVYLRQV